MHLNADFSVRAAMHAATLDWIPSPVVGVERRMLDRTGGEVARATSLVRYAPGSRFAPHTHDGGEEFLVLDGVFEDEHGAFGPGSYVRNPPTTRHRPGSALGCVIFVKLWQFDLADRTQVRLDGAALPYRPVPDRPGITEAPLFEDARERVRLECWPASTRIVLGAPGGLELLVLAGGFSDGGEAFGVQSWLRLPAGAALRAATGPAGARVWVKTGHLARLAVAG